MLALLDEGEFVVPERYLTDLAAISQLRGVEILDGVDGRSTAGHGEALHVATFRAAEAENTLLGENIQRERVDSLLIDHDEAFTLLTHRSFEIHNLPTPLVQPLSFALDQLLTLLGVRVEETTLHLRLFVFEGDIARHDVTIVQHLGHIRMSPAMIQHQPIHESRIRPHLALHCHNLHHIQIHRRLGRILGNDALHGVHDGVGDLIREIVLQFGFEGGRRETTQ
mmetsp:Transcript_1708/g.3815  ORF Transcript_1708/g.3815 Transcript_1708/m.3815 type:complete len:224 (+) Transcript_1708:813-1484(+)